MSLKAKLLLDSSDYNKKMDQAKSKAASAGKQIKDKLQQGGRGFEAINKFGGKFGGVLKNLTEGIAGLMSPIGLVMAGVAALGALAVKTWDKMNESIQEYKERIKILLGILQKQQKERDELNKKQNEQISILQKLASKQKLSNTEKILAMTIIQELTKRYGDLGISIDQVTGAIKGFDEAQKKIKAQQLDDKLTSTAKQRIILQRTAHRQASAMMNEIGHETYFGGGQTFRYDTDRYKSLKDARNMGFDVKFNPTHDLTYIPGSGRAPGVWRNVEISDEDKRLRKLWNEGGLEGKREFAKGMLQRANGDADQVKMYQELYEALDKLIKKRQQFDDLKKYGTTNVNDLVAEFNKEVETSDKIVEQHNKKINEGKARQDKINRDSEYKSLDTDAQRIVFLEKELNELKKVGVELEQKSKKSTAEYEDLKKKQADLVKQYNEAVKNGNEKQSFEIAKKMLELAKQKNEISKQQTADMLAEQANLEDQLRLETAIKQLKQKSSDYYASSLEALNAEIQITKLKLKGLNEQAQKQQLINELKLKGLMVDEAEVDKILAKRRELAKLNKQIEQNKNAQNFNKGLKGKGNDIVSQATKQVGLTQQIRRQEALKNAEKEKGAKLTDDEIKKVEALADAQALMESNSYNFDKNLDIKTNQMTSRGGFASGAVSRQKWDVNNQIRDAQQQSNRILQDIKTILQNGGVI